MHSETLRSWIRKFQPFTDPESAKGKVYFFCDEFTNYNDTNIGITAIQLLDRLGYEVKFVDHLESGRTMFSKGMLQRAREIAIKNVEIFKDLINRDAPLIGIEPSAILTFKG